MDSDGISREFPCNFMIQCYFMGFQRNFLDFYWNLLNWDGTLVIWKGLSGISMNFMDFYGVSGHVNVTLWIFMEFYGILVKLHWF